MQQISCVTTGQYTKRFYYKCPKCSKTLTEEYTFPHYCPHCKGKLEAPTLLVYPGNQDYRVRHFFTGVV